jgi:hypothetical protein
MGGIQMGRVVPAKSHHKAASAFKNFSLSKFPQKSTPPNYVPAAANKPADVATVHRKVMTSQLRQLDKTPPATGGLTIALPDASVKKFLPSFNPKSATIQLTDVMNLMAKSMRGTQFYTKGNPTLNRLAVQSQVQDIMAGITKGGTK